MKRQISSSSLKSLLDSSRDQDLDSCCSDSDVFDPPAWRPGRFLQFADIDLTVEDEPSVRPVSLPTGPLGPRVAGDGFVSVKGASSDPFVVQMESEPMSSARHWRPLVSRRTMLLVTSCMAVALTALTLLSFVLYC